MIKGKGIYIIVILGALLVVGSYWAGLRHKNRTIRWYSDMTSQIQGHKIYLIDTPVFCPNRQAKLATGQIQMVPGKEIGKIQLDVNLQNGDLKVVTNTVPAWFDCDH
jgi:hypothetical protein